MVSLQVLNEVFDLTKRWESWLLKNQDAPELKGTFSKIMGIRGSSKKVNNDDDQFEISMNKL